MSRPCCSARLLACALLLSACEPPSSPAPAPARPLPAAPKPPLPEVSAAEQRAEQPNDPAAPPTPCGDADQCYAKAAEAERAGEHARAAQWLGHACDRELGQACFRLGSMLRDGPHLKPDEARARELFERGCRYGSTSACDALGH